MTYEQFLQTKQNKFQYTGIVIKESGLNKSLFDFQKYAVKIALQKGRFALFFDCGLGKTIIQLEWAKIIAEQTSKPVLILAPLAVSNQTIKEAEKFGITIKRFEGTAKKGIHITNYEQLENIDCSLFSGVVLDESSILKAKEGVRANLVIEKFKETPYKLACTATPSPNDHMELGMHSEFLGAMSYNEMLAMYFVHDGGETSKWRLRKYAKDDFWKYVCTWSMSMDKPSTLGFDACGYDLPEIEYIEHKIKLPAPEGKLLNVGTVSATDLHQDLKLSFDKRIKKTIEIVKQYPNEQIIIWGLQNRETTEIAKLLPEGFNVHGGDSKEWKSEKLIGFANNEFPILITKTSIASFGMNYQNCHIEIFVSYDFKFEAFYQAVRRVYRFGQKEKCLIHLLIPETQLNVRKTILKKQKQHFEMIAEMSKYSANTDYKSIENKKVMKKEVKTKEYHCINGDAVQEIKKLTDGCSDLTVFSPPFAELYVYSDKKEDMGNVKNYKEFEKHFSYLIPELKRTLKPGRICAIHCMDLPIQKGKEGFIGLRDFSGFLIDWFTKHGFIYHSRVTIWKNPVTEMQRTKALGLLHKQIKKDSVMSRVGIPDYILFFRNEGENEIPIKHQDTDMTKPDYLPVDLWQKYASPVWYDVDYSRTLQYRSARDNNDEKHIAPLQLDTIERILHLYSNEGETIFSPFGGIGSEGYQALKMKRKSISIELKESYFNINVENHQNAVNSMKMKTIF